MKIYEVNQIDDNSYYINDEDNDSCYLIVGTTNALLIDCGLFKEALLPTIKQITDLEILLVLTHGHGDHVGCISEFNNVYMSSKDKDVYFWNQEKFPDIKLIDYNDIRLIKNHQELNIGNKIIELVELPGHTPGSLLVVDSSNKTIYTGDAIGSGCGVWMQIPHTLPLSSYRDSLKEVIEYLEYIGVDDNWQFWGGHNQQESMSKVSSFNKLDFSLMKDMKVLCDKLLNDEIQGTLSKAPTFTDESAYYASFGKAEMIYKLANKC